MSMISLCKPPIWIPLTFLLSLFSCTGNQPKISATPLNIQTKENPTWHHERVVPLETHQDALLGNINKVEIDSRNGDFLIGDYDSAKKVFRFSADGKFVQGYGALGQGPGEYEKLVGFTQSPAGGIHILSTSGIITLNRDGSFKKMLPLRFTGREIISNENYLVIRGISFHGARNKHAVRVFNHELEELTTFHENDPRLDKLAYMPRSSIALFDDKVFVSEIYDFEFSAYELDEQRHSTDNRFRIGPKTDLSSYWREKRLSQEARSAIMSSIRRADWVYADEDELFFIEFNPGKPGLSFFTYDPATEALAQYQSWDLVGYTGEKDFLPLGGVVGAYENGLVGFCDSPELINQHRDRYPALQKKPFSLKDNPVLILVRLPGTTAAPDPGAG